MRFNLGEVANCFGVRPATVRQWVDSGCPVIQRGSQQTPWAFETAAVQDWLVEESKRQALAKTKDVDIAEARRRKIAAEVGLLELRLDEERSKHVLVEDVRKVLVAEYAETRRILDVLPAKLAAMAPESIREEMLRRSEKIVGEARAELRADWIT